jgi:hypothetical protein
MKSTWLEFLRTDPRPALLQTKNPALLFAIERDLNNDIGKLSDDKRVPNDSDLEVASLKEIWKLPEVLKLLKKQLPTGEWSDPQAAKHQNSPTNYGIIETYRALGILVDIYSFNKNHKAIQSAAEFIFSTQTKDGDFRGAYGLQYSPNYCSGLLELLINAGYIEDPRIYIAFKWLLSVQQKEGGWTLPMQTHEIKMQLCEKAMKDGPVYQFQPEKPFAHFVTGIVLRSFAAHPTYRKHPDALKAATIITERFFKPDLYSSYKAAENWKHYSFPFWWNDYIAVLDALSKMGLPRENAGVTKVLHMFRDTQLDSGLWNLSLLKGKGIPDLDKWGNLALCRAIKRIFEQ